MPGLCEDCGEYTTRCQCSSEVRTNRLARLQSFSRRTTTFGRRVSGSLVAIPGRSIGATTDIGHGRVNLFVPYHDVVINMDELLRVVPNIEYVPREHGISYYVLPGDASYRSDEVHLIGPLCIDLDPAGTINGIDARADVTYAYEVEDVEYDNDDGFVVAPSFLP